MDVVRIQILNDSILENNFWSYAHPHPPPPIKNCAKMGQKYPLGSILNCAKMGQKYLLTPSNGYIGFSYHPLVRPKRHGTACAIGPKGEARTHRLCAPSGLYIQEVILPLVMVILGFLTIPWLGPKDTEPHAPLVPKEKLGHIDHMCHLS